MRKRTLLLLVALTLSGARAAEPAGPPKPKGLMAMMQRGMAGHAVIAVGEGPWQTRDGSYDGRAFADATDEIGRLQVISKAASTDKMPLIPFQVGKAWVIAPQFRQDLNTGLGGLTPVSVASADTLLVRALLSLTPEQMRQAGAGLPVSRLPRETQEALALCFQPPLDVLTPREGKVRYPDGVERDGWRSEKTKTITAPLDWSRVRFRARLRLSGATTERPDGSSTSPLGQQRGPHEPGLSTPEGRGDSNAIPVYKDAPNTFRASDLDTGPYQKPIGLSGIHAVKEVVARLATLTGLRLHASPDFWRSPVFLGREDIACRDVMDGIRLALTGTWRRVGRDYVLAWDRPGMAADRLRVEEAAAGLTASLKTLTEDQFESPKWLDVTANVPFAPDDPLALTDEQRQKFFSLDWKPGQTPLGQMPNYPGKVTILYSEMTAGQQKCLNDAAQTERIFHHESGQVTSEPYTPADVSNAAFNSDYGCDVNFDLEIPGVGWASAGYGFRYTRLDSSSLMQVRNQMDVDIWKKERAERDAAHPRPFEPKAATLPARSRGLLVPALGPAEVTELIGRMKAHALDTLFYPALDGGYATFESKAFPLAPSLRGKDGFAAVASAAAANGIRLVAWLSPVAWQRPDQKVHWLDRHPDWLDVDALGRPRLEWDRVKPPEVKDDNDAIFGPTVFNYVRPSEPEVTRRLDVLLGECARLPGAAGLMLLDWKPYAPEDGNDRLKGPPPLGYALPDRAATLARAGYDPVDLFAYATSYDTAWRSPDVMDLLATRGLPRPGDWPDPVTPGWYSLARHVLERAKSLRADWTTYRVDFPEQEQGFYAPPELAPPPPPTPPKADVTVRVLPGSSFGEGAAYTGFTFPVPARAFMSTAGFPADAAKYPALATLGGLPADRMEGMPPARLGIYDFRQCPGDIMDSLRWIVAPNAVGSRPTGRGAGRGNGGEAGRGAGQ